MKSKEELARECALNEVGTIRVPLEYKENATEVDIFNMNRRKELAAYEACFLAGYEAALSQPIPIGPNTMVISNPTEGQVGGILRNERGEDLCPKCNKPYTRIKHDITSKRKQGFCDRCQWVEDITNSKT